MLNPSNKIVPSDLGDFSAADTIKEMLAFRQVTQAEFAQQVGLSTQQLSQVLHRRAFLSPAVAREIETETGIPAEMMLKKDARYRSKHGIAEAL